MVHVAARVSCVHPTGEANHHGYFVASQDPELRSKLKRISGTERERGEEGKGEGSREQSECIICTHLCFAILVAIPMTV